MNKGTIRQNQVIEKIAHHAEINNLNAGDKLPSIRQMAEEFKFSHVTVAKVVKSLAKQGFLETRKKGGTVIAKSLSNDPVQVVQHIILIHHLKSSDRKANQEGISQIIKGLAHAFPKANVSTVWHLEERGQESLHDLLDQYYYPRKRQGQVVFVLVSCPRWIKAFFQEQKIPCVVYGGNEDGISIPNVHLDIDYSITQVSKLLENENLHPAACFFVPIPIGDQIRYVEGFKLLEANGAPRCPRVVLLNDSPEITRGQVYELLTSSSCPRTLIVQNDEIACLILRICYEAGIRIPEQVRIITLESLQLGANLIPSITGFCVNFLEMSIHLASLIRNLWEGLEMKEQSIKVQPVLVFRESFQLSK